MIGQVYVIRNYRPSDFDYYVKLNAEAEKLEPSQRPASRKALREYLKRPNYSPEKDLFIAEVSGQIVGFLNITAESVTRRVLIDCFVHPEHRQKGVAKQLLETARQRAKALKAKFMQVNVRQDNTVAKEVLSRLGFRIVRQFFEMSRPLSEVQMPNKPAGDLTLCHLNRNEESKLAELQNRCFADTWGYNPNTPEEIAYRLSLSRCSPKDVILVCHRDRPIGYCWTEVKCQQNENSVDKKGRIFMLGVDPDYRGKGIGKMALWAGLSHLKNNGAAVVELTVDSQNQAAYSLYRSAGFNILTISLYYEKQIE